MLAIPAKRGDRRLVTFLTRPEIDALLAAPDRGRRTGRRDHTLLVLAVQTGLRVSELAALRPTDVCTGRGPHVRVQGKGRKERITPLTSHTVKVLRSWLAEGGGDLSDPVFPSPSGGPLGRDAIRKLVGETRPRRSGRLPPLATKHVGVHTLRHSCAMNLLQSGVDLATIALWLGHEDLRTVQHYLHADLALKERTGPGAPFPAQHQARTIPAARLGPRLPREPVIMRNCSPRRSQRGPPDRPNRRPRPVSPHRQGVMPRGGLSQAPPSPSSSPPGRHSSTPLGCTRVVETPFTCSALTADSTFRGGSSCIPFVKTLMSQRGSGPRGYPL